jgi:ribonuclease J
MSSLKFIALSGTTEVTENLYVYEYGNDMIVVDCGVGFPEQEMLGIDLIIPDFSYILENRQKLRGVLITHGHEDHIGALPFLLKKLDAPVYATKLVAGFIKDKLKDHKVKAKKINIFDPDKDELSLGAFKAIPFRITHSVPDSVGFAIDTPEGRVFHVPDYKFDWTPVIGRAFDVAKAAKLAEGEVLALASDCLGSTTPGYTESEAAIGERIDAIVKDVPKRVFFTTISSNISRVKQAIDVAAKHGRKVTFIGYSIDKKAEIANSLGYLSYPKNIVVGRKEALKTPKDRIMFIISGSYGQPGSNLHRLALGEHKYLSVEEGDVIIFSSDPAPPGTKENVDFVVDKLIEQGAFVHYYDLQEDLHTSGHGSQEDIKMLFGLVKPKHYIPIGGNIRFMSSYKDLATKMGANPNNIFELLPGGVVEFSGGQAKRAGSISVKNVFVDGLGVGDVGEVVLRDRQILSKDGIAIVLVKIDSTKNRLLDNPEIISRGFVYHGKQKDFLQHAGKLLKKQIEERKKIEKQTARQETVNFLEKYFFSETGRRPMVLPVVVEV